MEIVKDEPRALVLTGRMVYAFSNAYMMFGDEIYLDRAKRAFDYLIKYFYDPAYGGAYSTVSYKGEIVDDNKPTYSEAFLVMAAAAYYHATKDKEAYRVAMETFRLMEDKVKAAPAVYKNGFTRDWTGPAEMRFGGNRPPMRMPRGIMFQHHLCQAYEQLYRATGDPEVGKALRELSEFVADNLYDSEYQCFKSFMDNDFNRVGTHQSFGHDCEISYLAMDIAELSGDEELLARTKEVCVQVLRRVLEKDFDGYGSLINGGDLLTGEHEESHVWWAQAEAVTAMLCGYQLTGDEAFLDACSRQLAYIEEYFVNKEDGDWYNNIVVDANGRRIVDGSHGFDKLNAGKCPFHNSHMCFELIKRTDKLLKQQIK
jgi:mannobiose 2-epimerase